jgi:hypothetical protein
MSVEDIMLRGRWKALESCKRYIQTARALLVSQTIPPRLNELGLALSSDLTQVLTMLMSSVQPKAKVSASLRRVRFSIPSQW